MPDGQQFRDGLRMAMQMAERVYKSDAPRVIEHLLRARDAAEAIERDVAAGEQNG